MKRIHSSLWWKRNRIKRFINGTNFNRALGYNSYAYIQKKYPVVKKVANPNDAFRNQVIRLRFYKKLNAESKKIGDYLNRGNPIPEGERILLILTALENVINITLENEEY